MFDLDTSEGFNLKVTAIHSVENSCYYGMGNARTFYINKILYTASEGFLKINFLNNLEEINSIKLENTGKLLTILMKK